MDRIENHPTVIAQDQNNAAESNQALWDNLGQCGGHVRQLKDRFHDISFEESDREIERILATHQQPREQNSSDQELNCLGKVNRTFTMIRNELAARAGAFNQLKNTVLMHHQGNLQILQNDQEDLKRQIRHLQQSTPECGREMNDYVRWVREVGHDIESKLEALAAHVETAEGGAIPTIDHSEG